MVPRAWLPRLTKQNDCGMIVVPRAWLPRLTKPNDCGMIVVPRAWLPRLTKPSFCSQWIFDWIGWFGWTSVCCSPANRYYTVPRLFRPSTTIRLLGWPCKAQHIFISTQQTLEVVNWPILSFIWEADSFAGGQQFIISFNRLALLDLTQPTIHYFIQQAGPLGFDTANKFTLLAI